MTLALRRIRRAGGRLALSGPQASEVRQLLRDERHQREAAEQRLAECRRELREALAAPILDSAAVLELSVEERLLQERQRELVTRLEARIAGLLRPDQAGALRSFAPAALGDTLARVSS